jgi:hypothetical protein
VEQRRRHATHDRRAAHEASAAEGGAVAAGPLLLAALLPAGTDFGSADGAVLGVLGVSAGASGVLLGSSFLFPGPRTCTEILAPGSGTFAPRGSKTSLRAGARAGGTPRTSRDRSHGTSCRG